MKGFIEKNPHIKITITCQSTFHTVKLLEEDKIDIGLIGKYGFGKDMEFYPIKQIEDIFVASKGYLENFYLREKENKGNSDLLSKVNLLLLDEENISRHYIDDYFKANQIEMGSVLEVGSMDLLIEFAKIGLGAACVIKEFVEDELKEEQLLLLPLKVSIKTREIGFAYSKKSIKTEAMDKFIHFIHWKS